MVRVNAKVYEKRVTIDGVEDDSREVMSRTQVEGWLKAASWFNNLVAETGQPPERHEKVDGVIIVTQFNPEGVRYITTFAPV